MKTVLRVEVDSCDILGLSCGSSAILAGMLLDVASVILALSGWLCLMLRIL